MPDCHRVPHDTPGPAPAGRHRTPQQARPPRVASRGPARSLAGTLALMLAWPLTVAATELNLANQAELEQLKRVGPQLAQRILDDRSRQGPYTGWPDFLRRLKGVGPATAQRLSAAGLRIGGQAFPAPTAAASGASALPSP
jgi:competence protein ComEA